MRHRTGGSGGDARPDVSILALPSRFNYGSRCPRPPQQRLSVAATWTAPDKLKQHHSDDVIANGSIYESDILFHQLLHRHGAATMGHDGPLAPLTYVPFYFARRHACLPSLAALNELLRELAEIMKVAVMRHPTVHFFTMAPSLCSCKYSCNPLRGTDLEASLTVLSWESAPENNVVVPYLYVVKASRR